MNKNQFQIAEQDLLKRGRGGGGSKFQNKSFWWMTGYFGKLNTIIHYQGDRYFKYRDKHGFELGNISNKQ